MDKLEAVQRVLRFSTRIRDWCTQEHSLYFDDLDNYNVDDYDGGYGELADKIIEEGIKDQVLDADDFEF